MSFGGPKLIKLTEDETIPFLHVFQTFNNYLE